MEKPTNPEAEKKIILDKNPLTEEDERKKEELELIITRIQDVEEGVQAMALSTLQEELRSSTSTVTSIPKPLKFLKPHYEELCQFYDTLSVDQANKKTLADVLSVLAMTMAKEGERDCLKYKLEGNRNVLDNWGHEYLRYLSGEIGDEYQQRANENPDLTDTDVADLVSLVDGIVPLMIKSQAETDACDLLIEVERLEKIVDYSDKDNHRRICQYLKASSKLLLDPENLQVLRVAFNIFKKVKQYPDALIVAFMMNDETLAKEIFYLCEDKLEQKQMAFMLARQHMVLSSHDDNGDGMEDVEEEEEESEESEELTYLMGNNKLSEHFQYLSKELNTLEPKEPEDVYKSHLEEARPSFSQNVDSARQNLASTFVNAFINAGSGTDKLMTSPDSKWLYKNKDHGMMSAAASVGMLYLWNVDEGSDEIDKYLYSQDNYIKGGALLGLGLCNTNVQKDIDIAFPIMSDFMQGGNSREVRLGLILGLGMAYAGRKHEPSLEILMPILVDTAEPIEVVSFAALSLAYIFVGTCHEDISGAIIQVLLERSEKDLENTLVRFLSLALGLLFLGKQDAADTIIETTSALNDKVAKYCAHTVETCAHIGTGNVLKVQQLLKVAGEKLTKDQDSQYQSVATLGVALIAMNEEIGTEMAVRMFDHMMQYGDTAAKRAVPLALGLLNVSTAKLGVMDSLSKMSHDTDTEIAQNAILSLGLLGAGTNNARIAQLLRQLSSYYGKNPSVLYVVRIAQGLVFAGKGLITLSPQFCDRQLLDPVALCGLLTIMHSSLDMKSILLGQYHYLMYVLASAMQPRMLIALDEDLEPKATNVRVGTAVDTVAQTGKPRTITGFQTHDTPVLLQHGERVELATEDEFIPVAPVLEGAVILKKNPEWTE